MASTYTSNTGIELITTGEQSGTWGDTTNVNLQIIDRLTNGVGAITLSGTTHTLTTTDGTLSDGQYQVLVFGGTPSGTNTVTISPDDQQKVFFVKNDSGENVVLSQGSGGNVTVADGKGAIVYADGGGAGAEVVDVTATFVPNLTDAIGSEVLAYDSNLQSFVDTFTLPTTDGSDGQVLTTNGSGTLAFEAAGGGVSGPGSSTDNGIALFDGTSGGTLKDSASQDGFVHGVRIGRGAGSSSTNLVVGGSSAGSSITSGIANTLVGTNAGAAYTSGGSNTAVGNGSSVSSTGQQNTSFGASSYACTNLTTGDTNTALGFQALAFGASGNDNVAIGRAMLSSSGVSGNDNVGVGNLAFLNLTSGGNNIAIGGSAGTATSPFTVSTQSNRIVLGDNNISNAYIQVAWTVTSDERDKTDVTPIANSLDFVDSLNPVTFKWDKRSKYWVKDEDGNVIERPTPDGTHKEDQPFAGFLAQEVQQAITDNGFPDDIIVDKEQDDLWKIKETALIPVLVKAIQELKARVEALEAGA